MSSSTAFSTADFFFCGGFSSAASLRRCALMARAGGLATAARADGTWREDRSGAARAAARLVTARRDSISACCEHGVAARARPAARLASSYWSKRTRGGHWSRLRLVAAANLTAGDCERPSPLARALVLNTAVSVDCSDPAVCAGRLRRANATTTSAIACDACPL
mmetsp:Transcript_27303/g.70705  ORF Transcript_27303/g.70705 Transcript_27303/m.70705 type:complete len:165 (+) Transcript_27303:601-1095(+)